MINILDFYKKNLTYKKLIFNKLKFYKKLIIVIHSTVFGITTFLALIFLLDNEIKFGFLFLVFSIIIEVALLLINNSFMNEILRDNESYKFDDRYGMKENLKIYKSKILLEFLYKCDIKTKWQLEKLMELVKQEKELSKYGYKYSISIGVAAIISIISIVASFNHNITNLLISISMIILVVSVVALIESFWKQLRLFGFTKESKYINILILINIGLLDYKKRDKRNS